MKTALLVTLMASFAFAGEVKQAPLQVDFDEVSVQTVKPNNVTEGLNVTEIAPSKSDLAPAKNDLSQETRVQAQSVGEGL